jgi:hypothetical protein
VSSGELEDETPAEATNEHCESDVNKYNRSKRKTSSEVGQIKIIIILLDNISLSTSV